MLNLPGQKTESTCEFSLFTIWGLDLTLLQNMASTSRGTLATKRSAASLVSVRLYDEGFALTRYRIYHVMTAVEECSDNSSDPLAFASTQRSLFRQLHHSTVFQQRQLKNRRQHGRDEACPKAEVKGFLPIWHRSQHSAMLPSLADPRLRSSPPRSSSGSHMQNHQGPKNPQTTGCLASLSISHDVVADAKNPS